MLLGLDEKTNPGFKATTMRMLKGGGWLTVGTAFYAAATMDIGYSQDVSYGVVIEPMP